MRIFVSGLEGQLARSMRECAESSEGITVISAGRPGFDLTHPSQAEAAVRAAKPDIVVNAAAYTAVDKAESEPEMAAAINQTGAAAMAKASARLNIPIIQLSTDYVYNGDKNSAYVETDSTAPMGVYGQSKLAGELEVAAANPWHAVLRTSWVYSPFGNNFVKTMIRLGAVKQSLGVVSDQFGNPTYAPDLAVAILTISSVLLQQKDLSGVYHISGSGDTNWHDFASEIFRIQAAWGYPVPTLKAIHTSDYPTAARRPVNSRLNCAKLEETFGIKLPSWQSSLLVCMQRLKDDATATQENVRH
jgi:dTDP-4-dehydrorhamnose reductase